MVCEIIAASWYVEHYKLHIMHSTSLWLAFRVSVQQGRALEHGSVALNSRVRIATPTEIYQKPPKY